MQALSELRESKNFDFDAIRMQDECDLKHANDHIL
jgi:hypothetical protein